MSGGVDSAVAAARAVDAGHDVTGVHLALAKNPQSFRSGARGCCSKEDAHDARRAADVLGIPFYVWDLSDRFAADVVDRLRRRVRRRPHPEPVPALQREDQVRRGARPGRCPRLRRGVHRPLRAAGPHRRGVELHRAVDPGQGPVLRARGADPGPAAARVVPAGRSHKPEVRAEADRRGLAVADKPDSHDICFIADGDTAGFLSRHLGAPAGELVDDRRGGPWARTRAATSSPSASGAACGSASRPTTASRATCWISPR